jgi:16S rRNA G966 N2-methylase RsmD
MTKVSNKKDSKYKYIKYKNKYNKYKNNKNKCYIPVKIIDKKYINISTQHIKDLQIKLGSTKLIEYITNKIKNENHRFPYKKRYMEPSQVLQNFKDLANYEVNTVKDLKYDIINTNVMNKEFKFKNKYLIFVFNKKEDYLTYEILSDYHQEKCRMKCVKYTMNTSIYDYWYKKTSKVVEYTLNKYKCINVYTLREALYKLTDECTSFKPTLAMAVYKMFKAKKILDPTSGWGDRLIAAISYDAEFYCGVDPNSCLHPNYQKMIKFFGGDPDKFKMIESKFETVDLPIKDFDLVFTSPPFFVLESYTQEDTQSVISYDDIDNWINNFLLVLLKKSLDHMSTNNSHFIIHLRDMKPPYKFIQKMMDFMDKQTGVKYIGVIGLSNRSEIEYNRPLSPPALWVWQKN